jgi:guanylate kinase
MSLSADANGATKIEGSTTQIESASAERELSTPMLVVISGPSGVGKDTIIAAMQERGHHPPYHYVVTCTTRARRPNEIDHVSYNFVTEEQFLSLRDAGELLEANQVHDHLYGTPRAGVREALARGQHAILKIDVQGAQVVKASVPEALLIFVVPPSIETLNQHLQARRTETPEELALRQKNAAIELARQYDYDHVVENVEGHVDRTAQQIEEIISHEERCGTRGTVVV